MEDKALRDQWAWAENPTTSVRDFAVIQSTIVPIYFCPTRRAPKRYLAPGRAVGSGPKEWADASKIDYALNAGMWEWTSSDWRTLQFYSPGIWDTTNNDRPLRTKGIRDGLGKTYLVGEKSVFSDYYETGNDVGDRLGIFDGNGWWKYPYGEMTLRRYADKSPALDVHSGVEHDIDPIFNYANVEQCHTCQKFGSAHPKTWNAVFCDGAVHVLSYNISLATHQALSTRAKSDSPNYAEY
jgi:hypothetical protein